MLKTRTRPMDFGRPSLSAVIDQIAATLPKFFPLDSLVASNPLCGFERHDFESALRDAATIFRATPHRPLSEYRMALKQREIDATLLREVIEDALGPQTISVQGTQLPVFELAWQLANGRLDNPSTEAVAWAERVFSSRLQTERLAAQRFDPASQSFLEWLHEMGHPNLVPALNAEIFSICQDYLLTDTEWHASDGEPSLFAAFLARVKELPACRRLLSSPDSDPDMLLQPMPLAALTDAINRLGPARRAREAYLTRHLFDMRGWGAFIRWYGTQSRAEHAPASVLELLAMRLTLEKILWMDLAVSLGLSPDADGFLREESGADLCANARSTPPRWLRRVAALMETSGLKASVLDLSDPAPLDALVRFFEDHDDLWVAMRFMEAAEQTYRAQLLGALRRPRMEGSTERRPEAQWVFCIDVRSEPMRRAIESQGHFETFGYAGFFGAAIRYHDALGCETAQCPVLLSPAYDVHEKTRDSAAITAVAGARASALVAGMRKSSAATPSSAPGFVEGLGLGAVWDLVCDAIGKGHGLKVSSPDALGTLPDLDAAEANQTLGIRDQLAIARGLLLTTGLSRRMAPVVVLCAHGSQTRNNPFAAALNCGACGGQHGAPNARLVAAIMNRASVRALLAQEGLPIPEDTRFVAAIHDTVSDHIHFFEDDAAEADVRGQLVALRAAAAHAGAINRQGRASRLGLERQDADTLGQRRLDAAAVRPEWGLANNAAFIVGPRTFTGHVNLEGRAFLHSYDWQQDANGDVLAAILTAPMVVAQWINAQYLFSSVDNRAFGSGDKTTHNLIGCAVMQGEMSDIQLGLPWQSVRAADGRLMHEPLRLHVVVRAPRARVEAVLDGAPSIAGLFERHWLHLVVFDPVSGQIMRYEGSGQWALVHEAQAANHPTEASGHA